MDPKARPSKREIEILQLIAAEYTTKEIASILFITLNTVETHRRHLLEKMGARNTAGLIVRSIRQGYLDTNIPIVVHEPMGEDCED